jgi:hypothetical protein
MRSTMEYYHRSRSIYFVVLYCHPKDTEAAGNFAATIAVSLPRKVGNIHRHAIGGLVSLSDWTIWINTAGSVVILVRPPPVFHRD